LIHQKDDIPDHVGIAAQIEIIRARSQLTGHIVRDSPGKGARDSLPWIFHRRKAGDIELGRLPEQRFIVETPRNAALRGEG